MSPEAILLSIRDRSGEGSYRFSCPQCLDTVEKPADRKVAVKAVGWKEHNRLFIRGKEYQL